MVGVVMSLIEDMVEGRGVSTVLFMGMNMVERMVANVLFMGVGMVENVVSPLLFIGVDMVEKVVSPVLFMGVDMLEKMVEEVGKSVSLTFSVGQMSSSNTPDNSGYVWLTSEMMFSQELGADRRFLLLLLL